MAYPVCRDLEAVLKKGHTPAYKNDKDQIFVSEIGKMSVPCIGHEKIGPDKKK